VNKCRSVEQQLLIMAVISLLVAFTFSGCGISYTPTACSADLLAQFDDIAPLELTQVDAPSSGPISRTAANECSARYLINDRPVEIMDSFERQLSKANWTVLRRGSSIESELDATLERYEFAVRIVFETVPGLTASEQPGPQIGVLVQRFDSFEE